MSKPQKKFLFEPSAPRQGLSKLTQVTLLLSEIAERLARENRTLVDHADGRAENVAEHSNMLAIIGPAIAEEFYPELDPNLIARYASVHDIVEAYVGDTPTHDISKDGLLNKEALEKAGLEKLKSDFSHLPKFASFIQSYEAQVVPEARFVRVLDKSMPAVMHFGNNGATLGTYITKDLVMDNSADRAAVLRAEYPEFELLIKLREELSREMAEAFL